MDKFWKKYTDSVFSGKSMIILVVGGLIAGGILAVLAWLGGMAGGVPGVPPAIMGIVFLGIMFSMLINIFNLF